MVSFVLVFGLADCTQRLNKTEFLTVLHLLHSLMNLFVQFDQKNRLVLFAVNMVVFAMSIGGYIWLCITLAKTPE